MKKATKQQLINWLSNYYNDCGHTDYFGYKMSIEDFAKEMAKKKKKELQQTIFDTSAEGQEYIESFQ